MTVSQKKVWNLKYLPTEKPNVVEMFDEAYTSVPNGTGRSLINMK